MAEGAAATVLTRKANGNVLGQGGGEGEVFGAGPIERGLAFGHGLAGIEQFADLAVDLKIVRDGGDRLAKIGEFFGGNSGGNLFQQIGTADGWMELRLEFGDGLAGLAQGVLGDGVDLGADFLDFFLRDDPGIEALS